ncbi:M4 family metallopeptidase [Streptomyces sp. NPDC088725]|uniref:M4 family metallopeptidase n=1 Tax=Streptomyces sp. NPDC088725 TaxID=3365873 RepID=UPI00380294BA
MVALGVQTGASAQSAPRGANGAALALSPGRHAAALRSARADTASEAQALGLGAQEKLVVKDVIKDADGTVHTRYDRTYEGLRVIGGDLVVHRTSGGTSKVTKATAARISVATTEAAVTASTARSAALKAASAERTTEAKASTDPVKVIWAAGGTPVLAWDTLVRGVQPDGTPSELHVITDATTGKELSRQEDVKTGTGTGTWDGDVTIGSTGSAGAFELTDTDRGGHSTYDANQSTSSARGTLFTDDDDVWDSERQNAAVDAQYGAAETYDFYKDVLGRTGINGDGVAAYSRVHYGDSYVNAFWDDSCFCMTYGDGEGNARSITELDVAGHEMSHGVTAATAGLIYSGESGGLNEATSDIFGTAVEFHSGTAADTGDYNIGELVDLYGDGTPLRYMDKPSKDAEHGGSGSADFWSSSVGNLDVHYSSGVANHFFYLLSEGSGAKTINGVDYDSPTSDGSTVTGIGRDKAVQIWYKTLTAYMTSTTDYADARTATLSAAEDLYGADSTEYAAVGAAWSAVNVT